MFQLIGGILLGVLATLITLFYRTESARRRKGIMTRTIFMNVIVHNKRAVLKEKVREALPDPLGLGQRSFLKRKMAGLINQMVDDQAFTEKLAAGVVLGAPVNLKKEGGLDVEAELLFVKNSYFCFKIMLKKIDAHEFIAEKLDEKHTDEVTKNRFNFFFSKIVGDGTRRAWLDSKFSELVAGKVQQSIGKSMEAKLKKEAGAEVDVTAMLPENQAEFFFEMLQLLAEEEANKKKK